MLSDTLFGADTILLFCGLLGSPGCLLESPGGLLGSPGGLLGLCYLDSPSLNVKTFVSRFYWFNVILLVLTTRQNVRCQFYGLFMFSDLPSLDVKTGGPT
jgi:hypothetical protein